MTVDVIWSERITAVCVCGRIRAYESVLYTYYTMHDTTLRAYLNAQSICIIHFEYHATAYVCIVYATEQ